MLSMLFFFFKQKTAYEMRISDWSSDVCSSDLGKHSGRHAFKAKLEDLGFTLADNEIQDAFVRFKDLADAKKDVYDEDIIALVDDAVLRHNDRLRFVSLPVVCGPKGPPTADLEVAIHGRAGGAQAPGNAPAAALLRAPSPTA